MIKYMQVHIAFSIFFLSFLVHVLNKYTTEFSNKWHRKNTTSKFSAKIKRGAFFIRTNHQLSNEKVTKIDHIAHTALWESPEI